ncbi:MAG: hypothetical protein ACM34H_08735 [Deltaproteobacteria bacterium]
MHCKFANRRLGAIVLLCFSLLKGGAVRAEESAPGTGPVQWSGAAELGYRLTDVEGENRYREVVNLDPGLKLFNLNLRYKDLGQKGPADEVRLHVNSIGDPYPSGRLDIKKNKIYQVSAYYREYEFFFDRQDVPPPIPFGTSLTDNHDFNQKIKREGLSLALFPADQARFDVGYSSVQREGVAGVPRAFSFVPNLLQNLDERYNEYFVSANIPLNSWDFYIKQSYWTFENNDHINQPPTLVEKRREEVGTYVTTIKTHSRFGERWDFDAGYIYAHSRGDARLDTVPAILVTSGNGNFVFDTHVLESGLSYLLRKDMLLHFDYRFHTYDQDGSANTDLFFVQQGTVTTDYSLHAHTGTLQLEYIPGADLTVKVGYRAQHRSIRGENFNVNRHDGGIQPEETTVFAQGWVASADWKPLKSLKLFAQYEGSVFDDPYTRISPQDQHVGKVWVRYDTPIRSLTLKGTLLRKMRSNPDQEYLVDIEDYILTAVYQPSAVPGLSMDGSVTYERIRDRKNIANQIATPLTAPFIPFVFDSDALIYSGGIEYEGIYKGLSGRFSGNIASTGKENNQKYARGVLSFWYTLKPVTPILSFERSYLTDKISPQDSYSANLLTFSLRKEF